MRRAFLLVALLLGACVARAAQEVPLDVVFRTNGTTQAGRVSGIETLFLKLNVQLAEGQPKATISIPLVDIDHVDFGEGSVVSAYLARPGPRNLAEMERFWKERQSLLGLAESTAGAFGLALANLLLESPSEPGLERALELFRKLERDDWSPERRALARQGRLQTLVKMGRGLEVIAEAREVAKGAEDPRVLIEANYVLAQAAMQQLRELEKENPRWMEDDEVRPDRQRLYNEVLDLFLYPHLFHGAMTSQAARGLWGVIGVYQFAGERGAALDRARDLVALYPGTPEASGAAKLIEESSRKAETATRKGDGA